MATVGRAPGKDKGHRTLFQGGRLRNKNAREGKQNEAMPRGPRPVFLPEHPALLGESITAAQLVPTGGFGLGP